MSLKPSLYKGIPAFIAILVFACNSLPGSDVTLKSNILPTPGITSLTNLSLEQRALNYFIAGGLQFDSNEISFANRKISVLNSTDLTVDQRQLALTYQYFDSFNGQTFGHKLTPESGEQIITPRRASWQQNGTILIVPWSIGLPPVWKDFEEQVAFTLPKENSFLTLLRIPDANQDGVITNANASYYFKMKNLEEYLAKITNLEACQANINFWLEAPFGGVPLPIPEQARFLQEAVCNTFTDVIDYRSNGIPYDQNNFIGPVISMTGSDQKAYDLNRLPLSKSQFENFPINSYLK